MGTPGDVTETVTASFAVSASWIPDTTTDCDTFQFAGVNVNELGDTPTEPESPEKIDTDTNAPGAAANRTPNEPVEPSVTETDDTDVSIDCTTVVVVVVEPGGEEGIGAHAEMINPAPAMQAAASVPTLRVKRFTMSSFVTGTLNRTAGGAGWPDDPFPGQSRSSASKHQMPRRTCGSPVRRAPFAVGMRRRRPPSVQRNDPASGGAR